jgi:hypothetical protein
MFGLEMFGLVVLALLFTATQFCWLIETSRT